MKLPALLSRRPLWLAALTVLAGAVVLLYHARLYDFFCDDAFITLRFSRNLAEHGAPIYNLGERVEGYTNFLWMLLVALGLKLGLGAVTAARVLGGLSGVLTLVAGWMLAERVEPRRPFAPGLFVTGMLALSAPLAAWTFGGLETPLFAALAALGIAITADAAATHGLRVSLLAGAVLALATLTRPEGALVFAVALFVCALAGLRSRQGWLTTALVLLSYVAIVGPFVLWRWRYYGYPLPNTFYLKVSGNHAEALTRGGRYLGLAAQELGVWLVALVGLSLLVPVRPNTPDEGPEDLVRRRVVVGCARLLIPPYVLYVASVGGDFLDLYRFLVPLLPLAFVAVASAGVSLAARVKGGAARVVGPAVLVAGVGILAAHAVGQGRTGTRALQVAEPMRAERGIEPLGWTRLFALRWAAAGRWIAERSHPEDWMAVGAAGAMPFYSGIQNLDTLGLCDAYVSHHGEIVGNRPGHQRFASHAYILSKHPVYIFVGDSLFPGGAPGAPPRDGWWESQGYVWTDLTVGERYGAPELFVYRVLVRRDRALAMASDPDVRLPPGVVQ